jgi:hypothetical protein
MSDQIKIDDNLAIAYMLLNLIANYSEQAIEFKKVEFWETDQPAQADGVIGVHVKGIPESHEPAVVLAKMKAWLDRIEIEPMEESKVEVPKLYIVPGNKTEH